MTQSPNPIQRRSISQTVLQLRNAFDSDITRPLSWRVAQLEALRRMIAENEGLFFDALKRDLGKSKTDAWTTELGFLDAEIRFALKNLRRWMRPRRVPTPLGCQPGKSFTVSDPLGTVLIVGAWNYPVQLVLGPLVGAIAAGNCAVLKPSEHAAATANVLQELTRTYLDQRCIALVQGGVDETTQLLAERFDMIFYTGSVPVGKIVMRAAAEQLTPVVLELV